MAEPYKAGEPHEDMFQEPALETLVRPLLRRSASWSAWP